MIDSARRGAFVFASLLTVMACGPSQGSATRVPQSPTGPSPGSTPGSSAASASAAPLGDTDEGMWTLDNFPSARLQKLHGFAPTKEWLEHVQLSALRLGGGCSGSFVSANGLVMTNHHCAQECLSQLSKKGKDLLQIGFYAKTEKEEAKCPDFEVAQLVGITNVTDRVQAATRGVPDSEFEAKQRAVMSTIEKECATSDDVRCDVVSLYQGGLYHLYKYRRFQDVRVVFAPEISSAFFGGDPDNFNFPRFDLDVTFLRVWVGDKPAKTEHFFRWSAGGPKEGELTFVAGHPYSTERLLTLSELEYRRDVELPEALVNLSEERGLLTEFQARGPEQKRTSSSLLFEIENAVKAYRGRREALVDKPFFGTKVTAEQQLRARVAADAALSKATEGAWDAISRAEDEYRRMHAAYRYIEQGRGFATDLFDFARTLVRAADEFAKPNEQRLREFTDSRLPALKQRVLTTAPIHDELETLMFGASLVKLRETLGADDPFVHKVLGKESPRELAAALVKQTKLKDVNVRKALLEGGKAAIDASKDPLIALAKLVDPDARAIRKEYEDHVASVIKRNSERIAKARFAVYGTSTYPDATQTLRISYGVVKGWNEQGKPVFPFTTFKGAYERHTGKDPFALPKSWLDAKGKVALDTPLNFSTTNDIIGGNSGSPVLNKQGEIVGLIFDGNIHSLGGDYGYDAVTNRAVAVDSAALVEALDKIYAASRIVTELRKP